MQRKLLTNKGFSLIELMVVVAIIGILSAIGIPQYSKFQAKTRQSEAKSNLGTLFTAEKSFQIEWSTFTVDVANAGFGIEGRTLRYDVGFPQCPATAGYPVGAPYEDGSRCVASLVLPSGSGFVAGVVPPGGNAYARSGSATAVLGGVAMTTTTSFVALAWGSPNSAACTGATGARKCDEWTIDQGKLLKNPQNGIF